MGFGTKSRIWETNQSGLLALNPQTCTARKTIKENFLVQTTLRLSYKCITLQPPHLVQRGLVNCGHKVPRSSISQRLT